MRRNNQELCPRCGHPPRDHSIVCYQPYFKHQEVRLVQCPIIELDEVWRDRHFPDTAGFLEPPDVS